ncbi:hypothetical protein ACYOEI_17950 [Singulisphaera rosea]
MSRLAALLCLIAAISGTPLRQAEAASDFARNAAESVQDDGLESPDGGVGDDSGDSLQGGSQASLAFDQIPVVDGLLPPPGCAGLPLSPQEFSGLKVHVWWPPKPPTLRHAWLQTFLF